MNQQTSDAQPSVTARLVTSIVFVALFGGTVYWFTHLYNTMEWSIRHVKIIGHLKYLQPKDLKLLIEPALKEGFVHIKINSLEKQLLDHPWVDKVAIRRVWPDSLAVELVEQRPLGIWNQRALINYRGEVFTPPELQIYLSGLPLMEGPGGTEQKSADLLQSLQQIATKGGTTITQFSLDDRRSLQLKLESGLMLKVGRHDQQKRVERFFSVYSSELQKLTADIAWIDLRYANGIALRWQQSRLAELTATGHG